MEALAPLELVQRAEEPIGVTVKLPQKVADLAPLPVASEPAGGAALLRFALPDSTPPGTYEGAVQVGKERYPVVVDVEAYPQLLLSPPQLLLQAEPGVELEAHLSLLNVGNVPCDVGRSQTFGLFDVHGAERSIGAALRNRSAKGERRLDRFAEELATSHGGLVRVAVREGSGTLPPGELRELKLTLRLPDGLEPGRTYSGTWPLHNLRYYVRIEVPGKARTAKEAG